MENTIVIGLGNPILGDDGAGWRVAETVSAQLQQIPDPKPAWARVPVEQLAIGGLRLMETLVGYDRAILIDAYFSDQHPRGAIFSLPLDDLPDAGEGHLASAHDTTLPNALRMGRMMGAKLPAEITIIGIASERVFDFSEELSPAVSAAIPAAAQLVLDLLSEGEVPV